MREILAVRNLCIQNMPRWVQRRHPRIARWINVPRGRKSDFCESKDDLDVSFENVYFLKDHVSLARHASRHRRSLFG